MVQPKVKTLNSYLIVIFFVLFRLVLLDVELILLAHSDQQLL